MTENLSDLSKAADKAKDNYKCLPTFTNLNLWHFAEISYVIAAGYKQKRFCAPVGEDYLDDQMKKTVEALSAQRQAAIAMASRRQMAFA